MALRQTYSSRRRMQPYSSSRDTSPAQAGELRVSELSFSRSKSIKRTPFKPLDNQSLRPSKSTYKSTPDKKGKSIKNSCSLSQLFFDVQNTMKSCHLCGLSYVVGVPDDDYLHKRHCTRVTRGLTWTSKEEKDGSRASLRVIEEFVPIKGSKERGRIIAIDCNSNGKIGSRVSSVLEMINVYLSAPPLSSEALEKSRAYLFLLPSKSESTVEMIIGVVILTRIAEAMRVAKIANKPENSKLVLIDTGLYCYPERVPAVMGVSRLFVTTTHRRKGIATALLSAGARTFIHGCPLRIENGIIAFSQPTGSGRRFMESFGDGFIGIYEE